MFRKFLSNISTNVINKGLKNRILSINVSNNKFLNMSIKNFSTNNQISEKESIELIEAGVFEVLKSAAKCKHEKLSRTATLEELGFDSLDQVELVVAMEEKFGINISDDDSLKIQSVLDAIQIMHNTYVKEKVNVGTVVEKEAPGVTSSSKH
jgi:acyl carrier protein